MSNSPIQIALRNADLAASFHQTILDAAATDGALGQEALAELTALGETLLPLAVSMAQEQAAGSTAAAGYLTGLTAVVASKAGELAERGINVNKALIADQAAKWVGIAAGMVAALANAEVPGTGVLVSAAIQSAVAGLTHQTAQPIPAASAASATPGTPAGATAAAPPAAPAA